MTEQQQTESQLFFFKGKVIDTSKERWVARNPATDEDVAAYPVLSPMSIGEALENSRSGMVEGEVKATLQDAIVREVQALPKVWEKLGEAEQHEVIARAEARVSELLREVVPLLIEAEYPVVTATLGDVTVKDTNIVTKLTFPKDAPDRFDFFDAVGQKVSVSMLDQRRFETEEALIQADKDQGNLFNGEEPEGGEANQGTEGDD